MGRYQGRLAGQWGPGLELTIGAPQLEPSPGLTAVKRWTPDIASSRDFAAVPQTGETGGGIIRRFRLPTRTHTMKTKSTTFHDLV